MPIVPRQIVVRLTENHRQALGSILASLNMPHRTAPTITEAIRAAVTLAAEHIASGERH